MTKEDFKRQKEQTKKYMNYMLGLSRYLGYPLKDFCLSTDRINIYMSKDAKPNELIHKINEANILISQGYTIQLDGNTKPSGRYDIFESAYFKLSKDLVRDSIEEEQVQDKMRKHIKRKLGLGKWDTLECKVMDLFKKGLITWEEVAKSHSSNCEL